MCRCRTGMFRGEEPESHDARLAFDMVRLATDWESRNALGVLPLKEMTDKLEAVGTLEEMTAYF